MQKHTKILLCLTLGLTPILTSLAHAQTDLARADFDGNRKIDFQDFLAFAAAFEAAIKEYITTVVQRYRGRVVSWDVVNEGIDGTGKVRDNLFSQRMGNDYIARMFQYAREADPDVLLFYNDYGTSQPWARASGPRHLAHTGWPKSGPSRMAALIR